MSNREFKETPLSELVATNNCKICLKNTYPHYGKAPHNLVALIGGKVHGGNILDSKDFPDNFEPELMEGETIEDCTTGTYYCINPECENHKDNYKRNKLKIMDEIFKKFTKQVNND